MIRECRVRIEQPGFRVKTLSVATALLGGNEFTQDDLAQLDRARWNPEVAFQEVREHLGFETPRQRVENTVLRMASCLLGLFSVVSLIYHAHRNRKTNEPELGHRPGYEELEPTFSDALSDVRRLFWTETFFNSRTFPRRSRTIPPKMKTTLLSFLCQAV